MFTGNKGFTILEVVLGVAIFSIGLLGVAALQISAIGGEAFSARMSEGTMLARSTFEELMTCVYSDERLQDAPPVSGSTGGVPSFNLDVDMGPITSRNADADANNIPDAFSIADSTALGHSLSNIGTNEIYNVAWSICEDCLINDTKTVRVIVFWKLKGSFQSIDFYGLIPRK